MASDDLKRTLDDAVTSLKTLHHAAVEQLQKANEAQQKEQVQFLEAQLELIAKATKSLENAMNTKSVPFI